MLLLAYCNSPLANSNKSAKTSLTESAIKKNNSIAEAKVEKKPVSKEVKSVVTEQPKEEKPKTKPKPASKPKATLKAATKPKKSPSVVATKVKTISKPKAKGPKIEFEEMVHDFGEIEAGDIIKHQFKFKNTGDQDLVINSASASCGCTDPSYPFLGIAPGDTGYIGVTYNSVSKEGHQKPEVLIKTNASEHAMLLFLEGEVKAKPIKEEVVKKAAIKDTSSVEKSFK